MSSTLSRYFTLSIIFLIITSCADDTDRDQLSEDKSVSKESTQLVTDWYTLYLTIEKDLDNFRPNPTARALGYTAIAAYETCLPGMQGYRSMEEVLDGFDLRLISAYESTFWDQVVPNSAFWSAALNQSYKTSMSNYLIGMTTQHKELIDEMFEKYDEIARASLSAEDHRDALLHGEDVTLQVVRYAQSDSEAEHQIYDTEPIDYLAPVGDGLWRPTGPDFRNACHPYWRNVRTFIVDLADVSLIDPPVYSTDASSQWYREAIEVDSAVQFLGEEEHWIAEFWSDDLVGITFSPPGRQIAIANQLVDVFDMDLVQTLQMYLHLGLVINDAAIHAWSGKYQYNLERPVDYIRRYINPDFTPILGEAQGITGLNPNFPAYPSGHSTFASAAAAVFKSYLGDVEFTDRSHEGATLFYGNPRTFANFDEMAEENAFSRIPLGVHFRMDCVEGLRLGYEVGEDVMNIDLRRIQ